MTWSFDPDLLPEILVGASVTGELSASTPSMSEMIGRIAPFPRYFESDTVSRGRTTGSVSARGVEARHGAGRQRRPAETQDRRQRPATRLPIADGGGTFSGEMGK